jgi:hypothetical protein
MSHIFHHHPDGRIIIQSGSQRYTDTLENFRADCPQSYSGLPDGIKEFRYAEDGPTYYITDKDIQIVSDMDMGFVLGAIQNISQIIANQEQRLSQVVEEADPDAGQRQANEQALKQLASSIGIDTDSSMWRDALLIKIVEAVFKQL